MLLKILIVGAVVAVSSVIVYMIYRYYKNNQSGSGQTGNGNDIYSNTNLPIKHIHNSSNFNRNFNDNNQNWWETSVKNNTNKLLSKSGSGPDAVIDNSSQNTITQDDIDNYVSSYELIKDTPLLNDITDDDIEHAKSKSEFNDVDPAKSSDNIQYNLFGGGGGGKFEIVTSKNLYDQSEFPLIVDNSYKTADEIYHIDENSNVITSYSKSINETQGIDPSMTDGYVYFPSQDNLNNQNLINIQKEILDNRVNNTSPLFLENSILNEDTDFFIK
jgi:hypothetical protein